MTDALVPTDEERAIEAHARGLADLPHGELLEKFAGGSALGPRRGGPAAASDSQKEER